MGSEYLNKENTELLIDKKVAEARLSIVEGDYGKSNRSETEIHYRELIGFFKWLVGTTLTAFAIIAAVGGWFFYGNIKDANEDLRNRIAEINQRANNAIEATRAVASQEISGIQKEAQLIAKHAAESKVEEAFSRTQISDLIESNAKRHVGITISRLVDTEIEKATAKFQETIFLTGKVADLASNMRRGDRKALDGMFKAMNDPSQPEVIRNVASEVFKQIAADYDTNAFSWYGDDTCKDSVKTRQYWHLPDSLPDTDLIIHLVKIIRTSRDLNEVAFATLCFRVQSGFRLRMFDMEQLEQFCKQRNLGC